MEHESTVVTPSVTPPLFCGPSPPATDLNSSGVFDCGHQHSCTAFVRSRKPRFGTEDAINAINAETWDYRV
jgi:hypothetical protein